MEPVSVDYVYTELYPGDRSIRDVCWSAAFDMDDLLWMVVDRGAVFSIRYDNGQLCTFRRKTPKAKCIYGNEDCPTCPKEDKRPEQ